MLQTGFFEVMSKNPRETFQNPDFHRFPPCKKRSKFFFQKNRKFLKSPILKYVDAHHQKKNFPAGQNFKIGPGPVWGQIAIH